MKEWEKEHREGRERGKGGERIEGKRTTEDRKGESDSHHSSCIALYSHQPQ